MTVGIDIKLTELSYSKLRIARYFIYDNAVNNNELRNRIDWQVTVLFGDGRISEETVCWDGQYGCLKSSECCTRYRPCNMRDFTFASLTNARWRGNLTSGHDLSTILNENVHHLMIIEAINGVRTLTCQLHITKRPSALSMTTNEWDMHHIWYSRRFKRGAQYLTEEGMAVLWYSS